MNTFVNALSAQWKTDKLQTSLWAAWLATVFFSFWGSNLFSIEVSGVGQLFPFRILLPITALLYLIWAVREKDCFWKDSSALEKWVYVLILIMVVYGTLSLPRALNVTHTFRKLFNLCFDMCFFFLMLRLCRNRKLLHYTLFVCGFATLLLAAAGIFEIFNGGIFDGKYDGKTFFFLFNTYFQYPLVGFCCCNGFSATLLFAVTALALFWSGRETPPTRPQLWLIALGLPLIWFLLIASSSRLCMTAFAILMAGIVLYLFFSNRKLLKYPIIALLLICCVQFAHEYRNIVPPIQQYLAEMSAYKEQVAQQNPPTPEIPGTTETPGTPELPAKPVLELGDPNAVSLGDEFFETDEETGETVLNTHLSGGIRASLLLHAINCFKSSHGLGVGLGNTEVLAPQQVPVLRWAEDGFDYYSIHCFVARIIADYGLFVLLPLCVIAFLLLKRVWDMLRSSLKNRDSRMLGHTCMFLFALLVFPVASTADGDTQDLLAMWLYLSTVVLLAVNPLPTDAKETPAERVLS